jgi:hypothetical protein
LVVVVTAPGAMMLTVVEADLVESFTLVAVTVAVAFCVAVQAVGIPAAA